MQNVNGLSMPYERSTRGSPTSPTGGEPEKKAGIGCTCPLVESESMIRFLGADYLGRPMWFCKVHQETRIQIKKNKPPLIT